jgi:CubicO group peptidase (beta-lactamase class C family)
MSCDLKALDIALATRISEKRLPGVAVCIRGPEGIIFEKGYGYADENKRSVDENTIMGIGSMSKSAATLALAILATEGRCSFDDPVTKYFPKFRVPGNPTESVTLRHLAMHTAGIPPMEPLEWSIAANTANRDTELDRELRRTSPNKMDEIGQIIDYIAEGRYPTLGAPGEYMSYSNEGYAVLSYIVDKVAGYPLEQFLEDRVFGPMGMTRTILDVDCSRAKKLASDGNITHLWERDADGNFTVDDDWSILPPFRSCACVKSTACDMARYYQCLSNKGVLDGVQVIPAEAPELMVGASFPLTEKAVYCYGLNKRLWHGHTICEHSGGLHGVSSHGGFFLGENYSCVALCNEGDQDTEELCWIMYNMIMGCELTEQQRWLHPNGLEFSEPEMLTGTYICHEGVPVIMKVYVKNGKLMVNKSDTVFEAAFCGETYFQCRNEEFNYDSRLHFHVRDDKAWGCQVYSRVYERID